jgi:hypothetical protein
MRTPSTPEARQLANQVQAVNAWLAQSPATREDGRRLWLHEPEGRLPTIASMQAVQLRRVFNNGKLSHGGRLYGGWWLNMSQQDRARLIRIAGERTSELDFVAMVPRVCYALRGVRWPFGDDRDAPYIAGPQATRGAWKQWTNAMLFARNLPRSWPGATPAARMAFASQFAGLGVTDARDAVLAHHARLHSVGGFGCELGMEAMRAESDIAIDMVLRLRDLGITCLPVHDGFIVPASKADEARAAMLAASAARLRVPLAVAVK